MSNIPADHPCVALSAPRRAIPIISVYCFGTTTIIKEKKKSVPMHSPIVLLTAYTHTSTAERAESMK